MAVELLAKPKKYVKNHLVETVLFRAERRVHKRWSIGKTEPV